MKTKYLKAITIINLILILLLNIIGLNYADIMFYGFFVLIALFNFIFANKLRIGKLMLYTLFFVIGYLAMRHSIDFIFNYDTVGANGKVVPAWAKLLSDATTYIIAETIALAIGLGFKLWNKIIKTSC